MDELLSRLKRLEENLRELEGFRGTTLAELEDDRKATWALRYGLMESIQAMIDIACALVPIRENVRKHLLRYGRERAHS